MTSATTSTKPNYYRRAKALKLANRAAECSITSYETFGTIGEARIAYARFVEGWPSLAPHITETLWVKAFMASPVWVAVRQQAGRCMLTGAVIRTRYTSREMRDAARKLKLTKA